MVKCKQKLMNFYFIYYVVYRYILLLIEIFKHDSSDIFSIFTGSSAGD